MSHFYGRVPLLPDLPHGDENRRHRMLSQSSRSHSPMYYGSGHSAMSYGKMEGPYCNQPINGNSRVMKNINNLYSTSPTSVDMIGASIYSSVLSSTMDDTTCQNIRSNYHYDGAHDHINYLTPTQYSSKDCYFVPQRTNHLCSPFQYQPSSKNVSTVKFTAIPQISHKAYYTPRANNSYLCNNRKSSHNINLSTNKLTLGSPSEEAITPAPQNLKKDPHRMAKVRTELCLHYLKYKNCPYGDRCNYAHGQDELKYTKLMDLKKAELITDATTYRTHPCWTWTATGACPFGQRCTGIHDPRVADISHSWLPQSEISASSISTTVNIDRLHHKRNNDVHQTNPLLHTKTCSEWLETYNQVCNIPFASTYITELQRMKIVYIMFKSSNFMDFIYQPTHTLYDVPCMTLKDRYFNASNGNIEEIPYDKYMVLKEENVSLVVSAHKVAFGPIHEPNTEPPSIWFDLSQDKFATCTAQQAKRSKRCKTTTSVITSIKNIVSIEPFYLAQPINSNANEFLYDIYRHRIQVLSRQDKMILDGEMLILTEMFFKLKQELLRFHAWPVQKGREVNDEETAVPPCRQKYELEESCTHHWSDFNFLIWNSFLKDKAVGDDRDEHHKRKQRRLAIFQSISQGLSQNKTNIIPTLPKAEARFFILDPENNTMKEWNMIIKHYRDDINVDCPNSDDNDAFICNDTTLASTTNSRDKDFPISNSPGDGKKRHNMITASS